VLARLSLNQRTTANWTLREAIDGAHRAGLGAIGVWREPLSDVGIDTAKRWLDAAGLRVSSLCRGGFFTANSPEEFQLALDSNRRAIEEAAALEAAGLVLVPGGLPAKSRDIVAARRQVADALAEIAPFADQRGVRLAIEPMHPMFAREWTFLNSLEETCALIHQCNHPCLQMSFGLYHLWQEPRLLEMIPDLVPLVSTIQLSDWREPPRSENDRLLIGDGTIPISDIVHGFVAAGYGGFFEIEVWSEELWMSDYLHLLQESRLRFDRLCRIP